MTENEKKTENTVADKKPATGLTVEVNVPSKEKELVMEAKVSKKGTKGEKAKTAQKPKNQDKPQKTTDREYSKSTCVLTNTSMNTICLSNGDKFHTITVEPREIKTVSRETLKSLMKNEMVRRFFDKGILTTNLDAEDVSAHDAVVPEELKNPVERHESGQNVKAEVKTYRKEGTISLDLG